MFWCYVFHSDFPISQQERDRSPSPSPSPCTPPLDLATLHQQVDCSEPLTSLGNWSFAHRQPVSRQHQTVVVFIRWVVSIPSVLEGLPPSMEM
jgi:hypothetical protein